MKKLINQILKFGVVGIIATVIDYVLLYVLTDYLHIYYVTSATISFCVSLIFNYIASMKYVFKRKEDANRVKEFLVFVILSVIGLGINDGIMYLGTTMVGIHYMITKLGATGIVMVWNFVTRKIFIEKKE